MVQNPITFIVDNSGAFLGSQRGSIRALSNFSSKIYVVAPFESVSLSVSYLIYQVKRETIEQYLAPTELRGIDVLSPNDPQYQTTAQWKVWEANISQRALHRIAKYRAGRIGVAFNVTNISQPTQALRFQNYFATSQSDDLPNEADLVGDYFISKSYNFVSAKVPDEVFTYGDYAFWNGTAWKKGKNITEVATTENVDLAVDGSLLDVTPEDITENDELIELINLLLGEVSDLQTDLLAHITDLSDPHEAQANQVEAGYREQPSDVQTAIDIITNEIDGITDGLTDLTYNPSQDDIITSTTIAGAIGQLDEATYTHITDQTNPHNVTGSQVTTTFNNSQVTVQTALNTLQTTKVNKNPDTVTSVTASDKVYINDGNEKLITVDNLKNYIYNDLATFGYVIFTEKDENGLPVVLNPQGNKIYLYDIENANNDSYEEWILVEGQWERIGTTALELQNYYTKTEADALYEINLRKQLYPNTKNTSGVPIPKGAVVQFAGSQGDFIIIKEAVASEIKANPESLMGLAEDTIEHNAFGNVVWFGNILETNVWKDDNGTNLWPNGTVLYFDTVNGGLTEVQPSDQVIFVAAVEKASSSENSTNGILLVRIHVEPRLDLIRGVDTTGVENGDILQYNSTTKNFEAAKMKGVYFNDDLPDEADRYPNLVYFEET